MLRGEIGIEKRIIRNKSKKIQKKGVGDGKKCWENRIERVRVLCIMVVGGRGARAESVMQNWCRVVPVRLTPLFCISESIKCE
jgi:hypothetical protein